MFLDPWHSIPPLNLALDAVTIHAATFHLQLLLLERSNRLSFVGAESRGRWGLLFREWKCAG